MRHYKCEGYYVLFFICSFLLFSACNGKRKGKELKNTLGTTILTHSVPCSKPTINIYVENSASMDGYVNGVTNFEQIVYSYLCNLKNLDYCDTLNLNYINSKILPYNSDISDFIEKLQPSTFRQRGGNRKTTDISNVLKTILNETTGNRIAILVSDCIFSPGTGKNADNYLVNQQIGITNQFNAALKKEKLAVLVYQFSSTYDGLYYNREDRPQKFQGVRPFYIWVIGDPAQVKRIKNDIPNDRFKGKVENTFAISSGNINVPYAIQLNSGEFKLDRVSPKSKIVDATYTNKGNGDRLLTFAINVDYTDLVLDQYYLTDPSNYFINDKDFKLSCTKSTLNGYTNCLKLSSRIVKPSSLSIKLQLKVPSWVENMNDNIGLDINSTESINKTYGIKYILGGVYDAFTSKYDHYSEIKVSINQ